jgi:ParB family chromosome partitioning protein
VVSPKLLALFRKDEMTLDQLMAFTLTDDHKKQETVWRELPEWARQRGEAEPIRAALTEEHVPATSRLAKFAGIEAYQRAGGGILRDLFDQDGEGWLTDFGLLNRLAAEKLEAAAAPVRTEGWKWSEGEEAWTLRQKAIAGVCVTIGPDGQTAIQRGIVKPEDKAALRRLTTAAQGDGTEEEKPAAKAKGGLPASLIAELTSHKTVAAQLVIASNPEAAMLAMTHALALRMLYDGASGQHTSLEIAAHGPSYSLAVREMVGTSPAAKKLATLVRGWQRKLPDKPADLWAWLTKQKAETIRGLLAVCTALAIDMVQANGAAA